jgi:hypothetical protein
MKKNLGNPERIIRLVLAIVMAVLYFTNTVGGTLGLVLLVLAIIFALTSLISFCPIWGILGISSRKNKTE